MLFRELTELLRLTSEAATSIDADYEMTSEPHHRLILDTIQRLANKRADAQFVKNEERVSVSVVYPNRLISK